MTRFEKVFIVTAILVPVIHITGACMEVFSIGDTGQGDNPRAMRESIDQMEYMCKVDRCSPNSILRKQINELKKYSES